MNQKSMSQGNKEHFLQDWSDYWAFKNVVYRIPEI